MIRLLTHGDRVQEPVKEYYLESEEELATLPDDVQPGSIAMILTDQGLTVKMKHSNGAWITI